MPFDDKIPIDPMGWIEVVPVRGGHLASGFHEGNASEPSPHCRKRHYFDLLIGNRVVMMYRNQRRPGGTIDFVGPFDGTGNSHGWGVDQKRDLRIACAVDEGRSDGLFAKILIHDFVLNLQHQIRTKISNDRRIDSGRHHSEGIAGRHKAIVCFKILESSVDHADIAQVGKLRFERPTHLV